MSTGRNKGFSGQTLLTGLTTPLAHNSIYTLPTNLGGHQAGINTAITTLTDATGLVVPEFCNCIVFCMGWYSNATPSITLNSMDVGDVAGVQIPNTAIENLSTVYWNSDIWVVMNPPIGSTDFSYSFSASVTAAFYTFNYFGNVNPYEPAVDGVTEAMTGTPTAADIAIPSDPNKHLAVGCCICTQTGTTGACDDTQLGKYSNPDSVTNITGYTAGAAAADLDFSGLEGVYNGVLAGFALQGWK